MSSSGAFIIDTSRERARIAKRRANASEAVKEHANKRAKAPDVVLALEGNRSASDDAVQTSASPCPQPTDAGGNDSEVDGEVDGESGQYAPKTIPRAPNPGNPKIGTPSPWAFSIPCLQTKTGNEVDLVFKLISHNSFDWNSDDHVKKLNNWRNQIYRRAAMSSGKRSEHWRPDELEYLQLVVAKVRTAASDSMEEFSLPKGDHILTPFNAFFAGKTLTNKKGVESKLHEPRDLAAVDSQWRRVTKGVKESIEKQTGGRLKGKHWLPRITQQEFDDWVASKRVVSENPSEAGTLITPKRKPRRSKLAMAKSAEAANEQSGDTEEV